MGLGSESRAARQRLRLELWSWSAWLILGIVSYPAVVIIWLAPRAGLLGGLVAGLLVAYTAGLGYSGRRELERWLVMAVLSTAGAVGVGAVALRADRVSLGTAVLAGALLGAETVFVWHFLPWLVRDADSSETPSAFSLQLLSRSQAGRAPVRAAMGLVLLLALLFLGLGAVWSRGEVRVPSPAGWIAALGILTLAFMFVERMAYLERSAREGNLLMVSGSYRKWLAAALVMVALVAVAATLLPWRQAGERADAGRTGTAAVTAPAASSISRSLERSLESGLSAMNRLTAPLRAMPRPLLPLLLLLLLLLLAVILMWGFRRSRPTKWLLRLASSFLRLAGRIWHRLRSWLRGILASRREAEQAGERVDAVADPLVDHFENPELLVGLTARQIVIRTYHLVLNMADMLGHGRRIGQTPFEFAQVLQSAAPAASESVAALTWAYAGAMYGGEKVSVPDPGSVRDCWQRIVSALTANLTEEEIALRRRAYLATRKLEHRR